jgi:Ankyrin repeats (many copies)
MASTVSSPDNTIWSAAYVGDLAAVKAHIEQGGQGPDVKDPLQGSTALHWAAFGGHLGLVRWLVKDAGRLVAMLGYMHNILLISHICCLHTHCQLATKLFALWLVCASTAALRTVYIQELSCCSYAC